MFTLKENDHVGNYTVNYLIKEGDFTGTYKVSDADGNARFMKLFDRDAMPDKMLTDGVVTEIVLSRDIRHENIIACVDDGEAVIDGRTCQYLVCPFLHGKLLSEFPDSGKTFPVPTAKEIIAGVLEGLRYLHSKDLSHNDLTPRNIILEEIGRDQYRPCIIDLGHTASRPGGTPPFPVADLNLLYCAPETLAGMFGKGGDTFSAAAVLYTMLCGKAPWSCELPAGDSYPDKKKKVRTARKTDLDTAPLKEAGVDDALVDLICLGLQLDVTKRISTEDFLAGLSGKTFPRPPASAKESSRVSADVRRDEDQGKSEMKAGVEIKKTKGGGFADVAGMEALKAELLNRVIWVLRDKEKAAKYRISPPNGMILYGPPGCGKTFFAEKFAEESQFNFVLVNGSDLGSIYIHGTQGKIADLFREAEKNAPSIICFDEFDSFVPSRSSAAAQHRPEEVNEFLGQLNNCSKRGIFVIGTTNRIDLIDPAVLRKGRMDLHIEIPAPDKRTRGLIFGIHLKDRPVSDDVNVEELAELTDNYAAADIAFIVNEAAMMAALSDVDITQAHLVNSIRSNKSSLVSVKPRPRIGY